MLSLANIGDKIRLQRVQKGLNQTELASMIGINQKTISNWENNKCTPSLQSILKISEILKGLGAKFS